VRLIAIVALLLLAVAGPAHGAPEHAEIAFASDGKLWAARADGSERRLLVGGRGLSEPVRSPDGTRRGARARAQNLIPRFEAVAGPDWSPDGATIAYTHSRIDAEHDLRPEIRTIPAAGGPSRLLIRDAQSPDWSPDGTRILFTSDRNLPSRGGIWTEAEEVYSIGADGSCLTWLTNGTPRSESATWRPASGGRFDPGSCDPDERVPRADHPRLPRLRGGLWLGAQYRGLLLSDVGREGRTRYLSYDDCARFDGCRDTIEISSWHGCPETTPRRRFRMRGALVLYHGPDIGAYVLSGRTMTGISFAGAARLADVRRVVRHLRPYRASSARGRLAPPRNC
jgi:WD40 repeat protein